MASFCGRVRATLLQTSTISATRNALSKGVSSPLLARGASASPESHSAFRSSLRRLYNSSRLPVELGCASSFMPLHSATASALFTSLLSVPSQNWGSLSEGFATPL